MTTKILRKKTYSKLFIRICFVIASLCMLIGNGISINIWGVVAFGLFLSGNIVALIDYLRKRSNYDSNNKFYSGY